MSHQEGLGKAARCRVHEITGTQVQRLLAKLQVIDKFLPNIKLSEILSTTDYNTGEANCNQDEKGGKHVLQEVSIIGHLRRINALHDDTTTAIELGAGTGRLSDRLQRVTNAKLTHILIDRQDFEHHCRDRVLRARCRSPDRQIKRVVADIGSLKIQDYSSINTSFCMSKHLCGPACDLAITSLSRMAEQTTPQFLPPAAIATCCHYLCTWESFTGKDFWLAMGLTTEDFIVATTCSQWASLQRKESINNETNASTETKMLPNLLQVAHSAKASLDEMDMSTCEIQFLPSKEFEKMYSREEKAVLGIKLKQLFDLSRAAFCQDLGYKEVELVRYTTRSTEDRLLILR